MKALWILLSVAVFFAKTLTLVFVAIWTRWTLPRMRVDQVMTTCWQYLIPIGFVCLMGSALFAILPGEGPWAWFHLAIKLILTALGCASVLFLLWRAVYNHRNLKEELYLKMRV